MVQLRPEEVRFWSNVTIVKEGCWLWKGLLYPTGYGGYKGVGAHRVAYELVYGSIPKDLQINHRRICPNKHCVRPIHLYAGTKSSNLLDLMATAKRPYKLTWDEVREIRRLYKTGKYLQKHLAVQFGVSQPMIGHIVRSDSWRE